MTSSEPRRRRTADDEPKPELPDIVLSPADLDSLRSAVESAYSGRSDAEALLRRLGYPLQRAPNFDHPDAWDMFFNDLANGVIRAPYRRMLLAALRVFTDHPVLRPLAVRYGIVPDLPARGVPEPERTDPATSTCHVIIRADDEDERVNAEQILSRLGLEPHQVWSTSHAVSFRVNTANATEIGAILGRDAPDLGWTVVAAGEPDYLFQRLYIEGPDRRRFLVTNAPGQQTIHSLAEEIIIDQYPETTGRMLVVDRGEVRVNIDRTLHEAGVRDGDTLRVGIKTFAGGGGSFSDLEPDDPHQLTIRAQMDPEVGVGRTSPVLVVVARESLGSTRGSTQAVARFDADAVEPLIIEALPHSNLEVVGPDRVTILVPKPGQPQVVRFEVRATHLGPAELWIGARQGQVQLRTLALSPKIIEPTATDKGVLALREPSAPVQLLRILEQRHGDGVRYRYDIEAPDLGLLNTFASELIAGDRDSYVRGLFGRIERYWVDTNGDPVRFEQELRAFGGELLDQLVPVELQRILWRYRDRLANVMVLSTEPFIPWELLHLKDPDRGTLPDETCFLGELGLVRWRWGQWPTERLRVRPGAARVIAPDYPLDYHLDGTASERAYLRTRLGAIEVVPEHGSVLSVLRGGDFDLLHFVGHGKAATDNIADAQLLLEGFATNDRYYPEPLRVSVVEQNFRRQHADGPLVFVNACQAGRLGHQLASIGGFADAFIKGGAGAFVSSLWSVGDAPARDFAMAFYDSLLNDETVSAAAMAGRAAARAAGDATWLAYTVYAHPGARLELEPIAASA